MDIKSRAERSKNMSHIRASKTRPEMYIRKLLFAQGYRYRVNYKEVIGKPDLYFPRKKVAVFINGCFWHRHIDCKYAYLPKSNVDFWQSKFENNRKRDQSVYAGLEAIQIRYLIIWECSIRQMRTSQDEEAAVYLKITKFLADDQAKLMEI